MSDTAGERVFTARSIADNLEWKVDKDSCANQNARGDYIEWHAARMIRDQDQRLGNVRAKLDLLVQIFEDRGDPGIQAMVRSCRYIARYAEFGDLANRSPAVLPDHLDNSQTPMNQDV